MVYYFVQRKRVEYLPATEGVMYLRRVRYGRRWTRNHVQPIDAMKYGAGTVRIRLPGAFVDRPLGLGEV